MTVGEIAQMSLGEQVANVGALGGGAGIGFFIVKWVAEWLSGRMDKREARLDRIQDDLLKGLLKDVDRLKQEGAVMREQMASLQDQLIECKRQHAVAEGKIVELQGQLMVPGMARQQAQQIIAAQHAKEDGE